MPEELRSKLAAAAARSNRSLNAELVRRLERSLRPSPLRVAIRAAAAAIKVSNGGRGHVLSKRYRVVIGAVVIPAAVLTALLISFAGSAGSGNDAQPAAFLKSGGSDPDAKATKPGEGPLAGYEAYLSAQRTYPANVISPAIIARAGKTFSSIANADAAHGDPKGKGQSWEQLGPQVNGTEPGVLAF